MNDEAVRNILDTTSPSQFLIGVFVLVFGTRHILSADNLEKSLGGLVLPVRWMHKKRSEAADEQVAVVARLKKENARLARELSRYHEWSILATKRNRTLESALTASGVDIPPPPFIYLHEFKGDDEEDDDEGD